MESKRANIPTWMVRHTTCRSIPSRTAKPYIPWVILSSCTIASTSSWYRRMRNTAIITTNRPVLSTACLSAAVQLPSVTVSIRLPRVVPTNSTMRARTRLFCSRVTISTSLTPVWLLCAASAPHSIPKATPSRQTSSKPSSAEMWYATRPFALRQRI